MSFQVAYVPIGVGTFHLESAQDQFEKSIAMLKGLNADCTVPEKMLLTINDLDAYLDTLNPDLIVLQNITFANAAYASEVLKRFACPIVLWTLREPVIDGTRLRLNSLTGAYSAGNAITAFRGEGKFEYLFGAPGEAEVEREVGAAIRAAKVKYDLRRLKMISIGHTPQGFGFGRALDAEMMSTFGTTLDSIEARELINKAKGYTEEELADELAEARETLANWQDKLNTRITRDAYLEANTPEILKDFHQRYPNIQIQLLTGEYYEISEWLRRGAIDCGFLAIPASNDFETTPILHDTMVAILPKDHPMADVSVFPLEQLPHENFVRLMEIEDYEFNRLLDHYNIHPEVTYDTTSDFALLSMVEAGLGVSIVHSLLLQPSRYHVVSKPLNVKQSREICITVKKGFLPSTITQLFLQHVIDYTRSIDENSARR